MENYLKYYQQRLRYTEEAILESVWTGLQTELLIHKIRKLYLEIQEEAEINDEIDMIAKELIRQSDKLKKSLRAEYERLDDLELDVTHLKFMINRLQRDL